MSFLKNYSEFDFHVMLQNPSHPVSYLTNWTYKFMHETPFSERPHKIVPSETMVFTGSQSGLYYMFKHNWYNWIVTINEWVFIHMIYILAMKTEHYL